MPDSVGPIPCTPFHTSLSLPFSSFCRVQLRSPGSAISPPPMKWNLMQYSGCQRIFMYFKLGNCSRWQLFLMLNILATVTPAPTKWHWWPYLLNCNDVILEVWRDVYVKEMFMLMSTRLCLKTLYFGLAVCNSLHYNAAWPKMAQQLK